jgi:hypothetical protein
MKVWSQRLSEARLQAGRDGNVARYAHEEDWAG